MSLPPDRSAAIDILMDLVVIVMAAVLVLVWLSKR